MQVHCSFHFDNKSKNLIAAHLHSEIESYSKRKTRQNVGPLLNERGGRGGSGNGGC